MSALAGRIASARKAAGVSQDDAARKLAGLRPPKPEIAGVRLGGSSADLGVVSNSGARKWP